MNARTYVIGDIHGCPDEIDVLLDHVQPAPEDALVFLGDYIDRGPSPKAVVDRLLRLRTEGPRCVFLKGNHEDMFLGYIGLGGLHGDAFLYNGGGTTLASYGLDGYGLEDGIAERLPPGHREFFLGLRMHHRAGDYLCVHAGIDPRRSLEEQSDEDLLWIREEFIWSPHGLGLTILFGHTPQREVFVDLPYKVGLDTGLVYRNKLSCLELRDRELLQVRRGDRSVVSRPLERDQ